MSNLSMKHRFDDAVLFTAAHAPNGIAQLMVVLRLRNWSLPFSFTVGGHLLTRVGFTIGIGPLYFYWSWV